jgi:hypothetical protein
MKKTNIFVVLAIFLVSFNLYAEDKSISGTPLKAAERPSTFKTALAVMLPFSYYFGAVMSNENGTGPNISSDGPGWGASFGLWFPLPAVMLEGQLELIPINIKISNEPDFFTAGLGLGAEYTFNSGLNYTNSLILTSIKSGVRIKDIEFVGRFKLYIDVSKVFANTPSGPTFSPMFSIETGWCFDNPGTLSAAAPKAVVATPAAAADASTQPKSLEQKLKELKDLRDKKVITDEEYKAARAKLLDNAVK